MPRHKKPFRPKIWHDLTRDEGASTLLRLNVSQHVADLRLIFYATWAIMILGTAFAAATHAWLDATQFVSGPALVAAIVGAGFGVLAWTYQSGSSRLGVVDLFACEITTVCRVITIIGAASRYAEIYRDPPARPIAFHSEEQYSPIFDKNSHDLEVLEARVVESVTEFYTYLKAMRDHMRLMGAIEHPPQQMEQWHDCVRGVVYMMFLMLESGRHAIERLIEFEPERVQNTISILLSELVLYGLLLEIIAIEARKGPGFDPHAERLKLRWKTYLTIVPALHEVTLAHRDDPEWAKALALTPELGRRYLDVFGKPLAGGRVKPAEPAIPPPPDRTSAPVC